MDKALLKQSFLEKDIDKITYYTLEEKKILINIYNAIEEGLSNYNTTNKSLFTNTLINYFSNVEKIFNKRLEYIKVLKDVITKYKTLSIKTISIFDKQINNGGL